MKMQDAELDLFLKDIKQRVVKLEKQLHERNNNSADNWVRLNSMKRLTNNQWTAYRVKQLVDKAIDCPHDSPLVAGKHYRVTSGKVADYRINLPRWLEVDWNRYL